MTTSIPGPVQPTAAADVALRPLCLDEVTFAADSMFGAWQQRNSARTLPHCVGQLDEFGAMDNMRRVTGEVDGEFQNMWFADSDVYKTLEATAWQFGRTPDDAQLREFLDATAGLLAKAQGEDGYLNSYFTVVAPEKRWRELHWSHELYCAGHLIQAAVAAARTGASAEIVAIARRFADLIVERFTEVDDVDGHPEIETALVELYRVTGHRPYVDLARRLLDLRGHGLLGEARFGTTYVQDHVPVRQADDVAGHVVRQLYLLMGMVDVAVETHDDELMNAAGRLWADAFGTKTYITGAHGSRHRDEAFGDPFELPPDRAYGETCAAIASFQWNWRMLLATGDVRHSDEMERVLYNAIAGSTALDGTHFFYSNPLHLRTGHDGSHEDAPSGRLPWYSCACCPPNLARLVASLSGYAVTTDHSGLQIHLYASGEIVTTVDGSPVRVSVRTEYPWDGRVELTVAAATQCTLALRIPSWCPTEDVRLDGAPVYVDKGCVRLRRDWSGGTTVVLELPMPARVVRPHPRIDAVRGCVTLTRGPLVYCLEQVDLPDGVTLEDVRIDPAAPVSIDTGSPDFPVTLAATGAVEPPTSSELYPTDAPDSGGGARITFTAIPYFLWGNRKPGPMRVWLPVQL